MKVTCVTSGLKHKRAGVRPPGLCFISQGDCVPDAATGLLGFLNSLDSWWTEAPADAWWRGDTSEKLDLIELGHWDLGVNL